MRRCSAPSGFWPFFIRVARQMRTASYAVAPAFVQKISGTFHSLNGAQAFADIRSYLQAAANHDQNLLGVLTQLFTDDPWIPPPKPATT